MAVALQLAVDLALLELLTQAVAVAVQTITVVVVGVRVVLALLS